MYEPQPFPLSGTKVCMRTVTVTPGKKPTIVDCEGKVLGAFVVLQGFDFSYPDHDHNIKELAVDTYVDNIDGNFVSLKCDKSIMQDENGQNKSQPAPKVTVVAYTH